MSEGGSSSKRPWWFKILLSERRWSSRLMRSGEISRYDMIFIRQRRFFCIAVSTLLITLAPRLVLGSSWRCCFVSFGVDELSRLAIQAKPDFFCGVNFGWRAAIKGPRIGFVLNTLYLLINRHDGLPGWIRKFLLVLHFDFLNREMLNLSRNVFIVKQDYFGPSSLLVTMSWHSPLNVVGVQHGLMNPNSILQRGLYPGVRTRTEYVYDHFYQDVISQVKSAFASTKVLGPPYDCSCAFERAGIDHQVIFISSGQMRSEAGRAIVEKVRATAEADGLRFLLRPHPSEKGGDQLQGFQLEESSLTRLFDAARSSTLFIGVFSSLLYQAAFKGFRTVWLIHGSDEGEKVMQVADLPNASTLLHEEVLPGVLPAYLKQDVKPVVLDPAVDRLMSLLRVSFPEILG